MPRIQIPAPEAFLFTDHLPLNPSGWSADPQEEVFEEVFFEEVFQYVRPLVGWTRAEFDLTFDLRPAQFWMPVGPPWPGPGELPLVRQPVGRNVRLRYLWLVYADEIVFRDAYRHAEVIARVPRPRVRPTAWDRIGAEDWP